MSELHAQNFANTAWAFATVNLLDEKLFRALASEVERRVSEFNAKYLSQLHQWVLSHRIAGLPEPLSLSLRNRCFDAFRSVQSCPSHLQRNVVAVLAKLSSDVQLEFVTEEGYSIDARMLWEGVYVGVEVDGPSHFLAGCGGRSPTGATALKHRQLRAQGWRVVVVPYFE